MSGQANLAARLEERAAASGWGPRAAFSVGERTFTYDEVHDGAARAAALLAETGVGRGDRVLVVAPDGLELVWAFLGAVRLGAVAIPLNPRLTVHDHAAMLADSSPAAVVSCPEVLDRFSGQASVVPTAALLTALARHPRHPAAEVAPDDPAYAQYTSGTTGAPKAAVHRHSDPLTYFSAFGAGAIRSCGDDVFLSVSKMFFAYGLGNSLFFPLLSGGQAVLHPGHPRPEEVAALVARHRVTLLFSVPTFYAHLVGCAPAEAFASVRAAVSAGEPLVVALAERARRFLGCPVLDGLGSTEVGQTFVSNTLDDHRDGTIGRPLPPYELQVRDGARRPVPAGEAGTLWVRGPTVLLEYLNQPDATAAVKDGEWLSTGDRAVVEPDGFVRHCGRVDDIEVVGGINVAPREIEELLSGHPAVTEVAVAGVRDESGASRLEAFVVLSSGMDAAREAVAADLVDTARRSLAPYKVPRVVRFADALPRTPTGKLRRFVLRSGGWGRSGG